LSRKNAFENKARGDVHKVSLMSPSWMQTTAHPDKEGIKHFRARTLYKHNTRGEENRVLLADAQNLPKSIFNLGSYRHNVMTK
jgi:hypothetical protein